MLSEYDIFCDKVIDNFLDIIFKFKVSMFLRNKNLKVFSILKFSFIIANYYLGSKI